MAYFRIDFMWKCIKRYIILIVIFLLLLYVAWMIPDKMVRDNIEYSLPYIENGWVPIYTYEDASQLDDFTDRLCINNSLKEGQESGYSSFQAMLDVKNYPRYWHGYLVILRPLLCFFNYLQLRYFNMFLLMILISVVFTQLKEKLNWGIAISYIISLCVTVIIIVPWSLQFSPVYYIFLLFSFFILINYHKQREGNEYWILSFFSIGMITNYIDFLSAPLLTFGIPMGVLLMLELYNLTGRKLSEIIIGLCENTIAWCMGYGLCWIAKWIIASIALKKDVITNALNQAKVRSVGGDEGIVDAIIRNVNNIKIPYINNLMEKWYGLFLIVGVCGILLMSLAVWHRKEITKYVIPLFLLSSYPYIWISFFKEHSYVHWIFTYRVQMITVFCLLNIYVFLFDWKRCKEAVQRLFVRR